MVELLSRVSKSGRHANLAPTILDLGKHSEKEINTSNRIVAFLSIPFGVVDIAACLCCKDVNLRMNDKIEVYLENTEVAGRNEFH